MIKNYDLPIVLSALMNTSGGPRVENREKKFPGSLDLVHHVFDKLIAVRNSGLVFDLTPEEKWIIIESLNFVLNEYDSDDFEAIMDSPKIDVEAVLRRLKEDWGNNVRKPIKNYKVPPIF